MKDKRKNAKYNCQNEHAGALLKHPFSYSYHMQKLPCPCDLQPHVTKLLTYLFGPATPSSAHARPSSPIVLLRSTVVTVRAPQHVETTPESVTAPVSGNEPYVSPFPYEARKSPLKRHVALSHPELSRRSAHRPPSAKLVLERDLPVRDRDLLMISSARLKVHNPYHEGQAKKREV